jgi:hypothetical protein
MNRGHGHVFPRADGLLSRCGGPAICSECAEEYRIKYGKEVPKNYLIAERLTECMEEVARERYPELVTEQHGLFRALMLVMSKEKDRSEACRRMREKYPEEKP